MIVKDSFQSHLGRLGCLRSNGRTSVQMATSTLNFQCATMFIVNRIGFDEKLLSLLACVKISGQIQPHCKQVRLG